MLIYGSSVVHLSTSEFIVRYKKVKHTVEVSTGSVYEVGFALARMRQLSTCLAPDPAVSVDVNQHLVGNPVLLEVCRQVRFQVLPLRTICFGPRTEEVGFVGTVWPTTSQANS
jgi:hypothetical protein